METGGTPGSLTPKQAAEADQLATAARPAGQLPPLPGETRPQETPTDPTTAPAPRTRRRRKKKEPEPELTATPEECAALWSGVGILYEKLGASPLTKAEAKHLGEASAPVVNKWAPGFGYVAELALLVAVGMTFGPRSVEVVVAARLKREKKKKEELEGKTPRQIAREATTMAPETSPADTEPPAKLIGPDGPGPGK